MSILDLQNLSAPEGNEEAHGSCCSQCCCPSFLSFIVCL